MRHVINRLVQILMLSLLLAIGNSCHTPPHLMPDGPGQFLLNQEWEPSRSYIHLENQLRMPFFDLIDPGGEPFGAIDASGVVIEATDEYYVTLSAGHWCQADVTEVLGEARMENLRMRIEGLRNSSSFNSRIEQGLKLPLEELSRVYGSRVAEDINGYLYDVEVVASDASTDLCLLHLRPRTQATVLPAPHIATQEELNEMSSSHGHGSLPLHTLSIEAPGENFVASNSRFWRMTRWQGHWCGYIYNHGQPFLCTTIRVRPGQSGAGVYAEDRLVGVISAYSPSLEVSHVTTPDRLASFLELLER